VSGYISILNYQLEALGFKDVVHTKCTGQEEVDEEVAKEGCTALRKP